MRGNIAGATAAICACVWKPTGVSYANTAGEGIVHGARGINGGRDGAPHDYTLLAPGVAPRRLKSKEINVAVPSGSVIHVLSGGGGGWGDPAHRDPAASAADDTQGMA